MPSSSRQAQVDLSATPFYHCISRCVRRAFLCGEDRYSGQNYDHRKGWFVERLRAATEVFTIDVCAFAVMSNHFHVVLRVDAERAVELTDEAVLRRYAKFFPHVARAVRELPSAAQKERLAVLRERLSSISWLMRVVNEYIARRANKEDECTGRFWEGRFRSQALLDESALYTCMSYVDLNPVRAGLADTLEGSEFTSVQLRLQKVAATGKGKSKNKRIALAPFRGEARPSARPSLEMRYDDYVALLRWTGRIVRPGTRGALRAEETTDAEAAALLSRLQIEPAGWLAAMTTSGLAFIGSALGDEAAMTAEAERRGLRWLKGKTAAAALFCRTG